MNVLSHSSLFFPVAYIQSIILIKHFFLIVSASNSIVFGFYALFFAPTMPYSWLTSLFGEWGTPTRMHQVKPQGVQRLTPNASNAPISPVLQRVKATDYVTPEKYLEDADKIPSYYVFQSNMVTDEDLQPGMLRNLEVDRRLTVPTRTHIRLLITGGDVIHSWAVPSLGIKADAVPGRLQRVNCFILREGVFYGQCSELCGALHGFMPIVVEAVSPETYAEHAKKYYRE